MTVGRGGRTSNLDVLSKSIILALGLCCVLAGCKGDTPAEAVPSGNSAPLSLKLLDGVAPQQVPIQVGGREIEATVLSKNLGESALFLFSYTLPNAAEDKKACDAAINAEIDRYVANTGADILSRKTFLVNDQPASEVVAKSPKNTTHSIRCRVICTGKEIQSLTAITPDNHDASYAQALDKMFEEFQREEH